MANPQHDGADWRLHHDDNPPVYITDWIRDIDRHYRLTYSRYQAAARAAVESAREALESAQLVEKLKKDLHDARGALTPYTLAMEAIREKHPEVQTIVDVIDLLEEPPSLEDTVAEDG